MEQGLGSIEEQEGKSDQHSSGIQILNRMSFWKHLWCVYKKMLLCEYNLKIRRPPLWATVTWRDKFDFGFPDGTVGKQSACNTWDPGSIPGSGRSTGEGIGYPLQYSWASLVAQLVKNPPAGDLGSTPGLWRSLGEGKGYPLRYSGLKNSMDYIVSKR